MNLLVDFVLIGGIVITLLIIFLLIKSKHGLLPQKLLTLFFGTLFFYLLNGYSDIHDVSILYIITFIFSDCIEIFLGPLMFLYIKSLFEDNSTLLKENRFHFIPALLYVVFITLPFLVSLLSERYLFDYLRWLNENSDFAVLVLMLYLIAYIGLSLHLFYRYRRAMMSNFSTIDDNDFHWVRQMLIGTLIVSCVDVLVSFYEIFVEEFSWDTQYVTAVLVIILIAYLGYYGISQSRILLPDFLINHEPDEISKKNRRHHLSNFSEEEVKNLEWNLKEIILKDRPYLDEDLTLGKLAKMLPTSDKKLSVLLNQYMNTTFYDFVNKYRVDAVKEKLNSAEFEKLTLLGIAYESGFKSKTSFNRIFKRVTGLSPSIYKEMLQAKIKA